MATLAACPFYNFIACLRAAFARVYFASSSSSSSVCRIRFPVRAPLSAHTSYLELQQQQQQLEEEAEAEVKLLLLRRSCYAVELRLAVGPVVAGGFTQTPKTFTSI